MTRSSALSLARDLEHDIATGYALAGCMTTEQTGMLCRALIEACEEVDRLAERRDALLALVANISQTTPLADELQGWEGQRAALIAEVGTLRGRLAEAERERDEALESDQQSLNLYRRNRERLEAEIDRLQREDSRAAAAVELYMERAAIACDDVGMPEEPMPAVAIAGERCECCGRVFVGGERVATWQDGERTIAAHYGRCPEPEMWRVEHTGDWVPGDGDLRSAEDAWVHARSIRRYCKFARVRLVRCKVRP